MFIRRTFSLVLIILWLWPASLYAQSDALMDAYNQGQALYEAGQYEQAIPHWRRALELGEQEFGPNHPTTSLLLNKLALLFYSQGRYEAAEPLLKRALAIREKALGPDHTYVALSLNNVAALYRAQGRYAAAEPLYKRALAIYEIRMPSAATTGVATYPTGEGGAMSPGASGQSVSSKKVPPSSETLTRKLSMVLSPMIVLSEDAY